MKTVAIIAHRFGILTERGFREAMKLVVEDIFNADIVERWTYRVVSV